MAKPHPPRRGRALIRIVTLVAAGYLAICLMMLFMENRLLYFPMRYPHGEWAQGRGRVEDADFTASDGTPLHGWYLHQDEPRAAVLFAHGNAGNVTHRLEHAALLKKRLSVAVLVFDYRGYGKSQGQPSEAGILDDARAARRWLAERTGQAERDIVLLGESLGGGVAVDLAARDGTRGLILEKTFTSLPDVAAHHYPFLPVRWLMRNRLDSLARIPGYTGPLIQCHGDADEIIPYELGQRLFDAAAGPKQFITLPGGYHNDPLPRTWYTALDAWLDGLPTVAEAGK